MIVWERYAGDEMRQVWDLRRKVLLERHFWFTVMDWQEVHGLAIPNGVLAAYKLAIRDYHSDMLEFLNTVEQQTNHDVAARLRLFNRDAAHRAKELDVEFTDWAHIGMTSRDVCDNVELLQIHTSLALVLEQCQRALSKAQDIVKPLLTVMVPGRTHGQIAFPTTVGMRLMRRFAAVVAATLSLRHAFQERSLRGVLGPTGTGSLMPVLFEGDVNKNEVLNNHLQSVYDCYRSLPAMSQEYPRRWDTNVIFKLHQLAAAIASFAGFLRGLNLLNLFHERVYNKGDEHVGSTAMPHKNNPIQCERLVSLYNVMQGYLTSTICSQNVSWFEGDVADSAARRITLHQACCCMDGMLRTFNKLLSEGNFKLQGKEMSFLSTRDKEKMWSAQVLALASMNTGGRTHNYKVLHELTRNAKDLGAEYQRLIGVDALQRVKSYQAERDSANAIYESFEAITQDELRSLEKALQVPFFQHDGERRVFPWLSR